MLNRGSGDEQMCCHIHRQITSWKRCMQECSFCRHGLKLLVTQRSIGIRQQEWLQ